MVRNVMCKKLNKELPGLDMPPFPGPKGEDIFNNISNQAWSCCDTALAFAMLTLGEFSHLSY